MQCFLSFMQKFNYILLVRMLSEEYRDKKKNKKNLQLLIFHFSLNLQQNVNF